MTASSRRVTVSVDSPVDPLRIAPAIRSRLTGGGWPAGAEAQVADAVRHAVDAATRSDPEDTWH